MLTFDETLATIRALDTEPELLQRACREIADPSAKLAELRDDPRKIARFLLTTHGATFSPHDLMLGCVLTAAHLAGTTVNPDSVITLMAVLIDGFRTEYIDSLKYRAKRDPEDGKAIAEALIHFLLEKMKKE